MYSSRDINGFNVSFINSATVSGTQLAFNNLTGFLNEPRTWGVEFKAKF